MARATTSISRSEFDALIERAIRLGNERGERIDLEQARMIALELGVSADAWETAQSEAHQAAIISELHHAKRQSVQRIAMVGAGGLLSGMVAAFFATKVGDGAVFLGALAVAAGAALMWHAVRRFGVRRAQIELAAWWIALAAGMQIGLGRIHPDPIVFALVAWCGTALLGLRRRARSWIVDRRHDDR